MGAGAFYLAYALFEVPSNMLLTRFGARRWLARIMVTWGMIAAAMMFVRSPVQFYVLRFMLGAAEAGFFPGVVYYLAHWFPRMQRGRAISRFYFFGPLGSTIMGLASPPLLALNGHCGLSGWQWLFLVEGLPAAGVGIAMFFLLPDSPSTVRWLTTQQSGWIERELNADTARMPEPGRPPSPQPYPPGDRPLRLARHADDWRYGDLCTFGSPDPQEGRFQQRRDRDFGGDRRGPRRPGHACDRLDFRSPRRAVHDDVDQHHDDGRRFCNDRNGELARGFAVAYLLYAVSWGAVTLSQVSAWPDCLHGRVLALGCAAINTLSQLGAFLMPILWGRLADLTGDFHAGAIVLTVATAVALLMTAELANHVGEPSRPRSSGCGPEKSG